LHKCIGGLVKFFLDNWILFALALASGGLLLWPLVQRGGGSAAVSTAEAVRLINREKGVLIDVSEPAEFASAHAANSKNVPFGSLEGHKALPSNKATPVLLICPTGARAQRAVATLKKLGYERALAVGGGLAAWREAQLPVEKSAA
jgi:rhodanese-related sulfurtransferase